jgi:CheY-like chemotaxis protein
MEESFSSSPVVLGFVSNLMFTTRIESILNELGFQVIWIDPVMDLINHHVDEIATIKPGLILVDLSNSEIQWDQWINQIKSSPTTESIPLVCFGSHKNADLLKSAKRSGADRVFSRSQFFSATSDILNKILITKPDTLVKLSKKALTKL